MAKAEHIPGEQLFDETTLVSQLLPDGRVSRKVIDGLTSLYDSADWRVVLIDGLIDREYRGIPAISLFKALALPFLIPIASERALGRAILTQSSIRELCGFSAANVPGPRTFWHFRDKYSNVYDLVLLRVLVTLVLGGKEPQLDLPFVIPVEHEDPSPAAYSLALTWDPYHPPIEVTTAGAMRAGEGEGTPGGPAIEDARAFTERWRQEFARSVDLADYQKKLESYTRELQAKVRGRRLAEFAGRLVLPAWISTRTPDGRDLSFGIDLPGWFSSHEERRIWGQANTEERKIARLWDKACNVLVLRDFEGKQQVLLSRRKDKGYGGNTYAVPGGKQRPNESLEECARRELREETNLKLLGSRPVSLYMTRTAEFGMVLTVGVLATGYEGEPKTLEPSHHEGWEWHNLDAMPAPLFEPTAIALSQYQQKKYPDLTWKDVEDPIPSQIGLFDTDEWGK